MIKKKINCMIDSLKDEVEVKDILRKDPGKVTGDEENLKNIKSFLLENEIDLLLKDDEE